MLASSVRPPTGSTTRSTPRPSVSSRTAAPTSSRGVVDAVVHAVLVQPLEALVARRRGQHERRRRPPWRAGSRRGRRRRPRPGRAPSRRRCRWPNSNRQSSAVPNSIGTPAASSIDSPSGIGVRRRRRHRLASSAWLPKPIVATTGWPTAQLGRRRRRPRARCRRPGSPTTCGFVAITPPARCSRSPPWMPTAWISMMIPPGRSSGSGTSTYSSTSGPPVRRVRSCLHAPTAKRASSVSGRRRGGGRRPRSRRRSGGGRARRPRGGPAAGRCRAAGRPWRSSGGPGRPTGRCRPRRGRPLACFVVRATPERAAPWRPMMMTGRSLPSVGSSSYGTHVHTTSPGSGSPSRAGVYSMRTPVSTGRVGGSLRRVVRPVSRSAFLTVAVTRRSSSRGTSSHLGIGSG